MLYDQLRLYLPCFSCSRVCIVCAVDLQHVCPSHDFLGFAGIYEGSDAVNVSVEHVVLWVLVRTVDAFFCEQYGYVRTCNAGYIGVIVNRTTNLVLDHIDGFSLCSDLLSGDRNTADTLRRTFHQTVDMGLSHVADNHQVVSAMPCAHSHSADIVLESSGSNLCGDGLHRLRVDIFHELCRRQRNALLQRLGNLAIFKRTHVLIFCSFSPGPASSSRLVFVKVFQQFDNIDLFVSL